MGSTLLTTMQELFTEDASVKVEIADQSANPAPAENSASPEHVAVNVTLQLPPMPEPNTEEMSSQACGGICCVTTLILGELAFAHFVVVILGKPGLVVTIIFLSIMWLDAIFAVICLLYILNGDPGEVSQSPEACDSLPVKVQARLEGGLPLTDIKENIKEIIDGEEKTFCVRCCVWRPKGSHHCRTCNRCVVKFDHHCGVFGRCIAGDQTWCSDDTETPIPGTAGVPGNMPYFNGILYAAGIATAANLVFFVVSVIM